MSIQLQYIASSIKSNHINVEIYDINNSAKQMIELYQIHPINKMMFLTMHNHNSLLT